MMRIRLLVLIVGGCLLLAINAPAMSRWAALSMIESGNNDRAVGSCGEVSRYQIRPNLWPGGNARNQQNALAVARNIMRRREARFEKTHHRRPTDFEFYVLWNAPWEVGHPSKVVAARAVRFANLVQRPALDRFAMR